jgi:serine/threonine protein kinase
MSLSIHDLTELVSEALEEMEGTVSREASEAHFREKYVKIKYLSCGDNGYTFAAIAKADAEAVFAEYLKDTRGLYDALGSKLVAVKFPKEDNLEGDLSNEIDFLTRTMTVKHPCYTYAVDSHIDDKVQWLALPYFPGGSLKSYVKDRYFPVSFLWHIGLQLAEAVTFLHFGTTDTKDSKMTPVQGWPTVYHADIFAGNMLLRSAPEDATIPYPEMVLADFGRAKVLLDDDDFDRANMAKYRVIDIRYIGEVLGKMLNENLDDVEGEREEQSIYQLKFWIARLIAFGVSDLSEYDGKAVRFVAEFMQAAREEREENYRDLLFTRIIDPVREEDFDYALGLVDERGTGLEEDLRLGMWITERLLSDE